MDKLRQRCLDYVNDTEPTAHLAMGEFTYTKMKQCFAILKSIATSAGAAITAAAASSGHGSVRKPLGAAPFSATSSSNNNNNNQELESRVLALEQLVQQRDNEIAIMVNMIRKDSANGSGSGSLPASLLARQLAPDNQAEASNVSASAKRSSKAPQAPVDTSFAATFRVEPAVLDDPTKAFDAFKAHYPKQDVIRENKVLLKRKYDAAKALASSVNDARNQIKHLTLQIEKLRKQQAIADTGLAGDSDAKATDASHETTTAAAEDKLKDAIEQCKARYKQGFVELSELKKEIQHIQKMLEMSRIKLQKDFDLWYQRQGKGALLTETLVAQPKVTTSSSDDVSSSNQHATSLVTPVKSDSPARPERGAKSLASSASKTELWDATAKTAASPSLGRPGSSDAKKIAASTPRSSTMRSSTTRCVLSSEVVFACVRGTGHQLTYVCVDGWTMCLLADDQQLGRRRRVGVLRSARHPQAPKRWEEVNERSSVSHRCRHL